MEAVASRHFGCIVEVEESGIVVLVLVEARKKVVLSRRVVEQDRSLLESSSWNEGKRCVGQQEPKRQMDLAELGNDIRLAVGRAEGVLAYTRPVNNDQLIAHGRVDSIAVSLTALTTSCSRTILTRV